MARDRKGLVTHNCLAGCTFDHKFSYLSTGWEGSVSDSTMFLDSRITDLTVPPGKYYLADAGFPLASALLTPYRGVRYHLAEWGHADLRCIAFYIHCFLHSYILISPANAKEVFNLRHASARNIIERMFGILKNWFAILRRNPDLTPDIQARLPAALAALHNVIHEYDQDNLDSFLDESEFTDQDIDELDLQAGDEGQLAEGPPGRAEKRDADERRDAIAECMWIQYQQVLASRAGEEI